MPQATDKSFERFVVQQKKKLQSIARRTGGEYQLDDVVHEAWMMAWKLSTSDGESFNLASAACQEKLLRHLHQRLVHYTEQKIRHAVRLDHAPQGNDGDDVHPLARMLVSNEGSNPLSDLIAQEAAAALDAGLDAHGSLAAAYVRLLQHFDNKMPAVAGHLLISTSHAYRRCAQAGWLATHARHIPVPAASECLPGPWRSFRLRRIPVQLAFDFDDELPFQAIAPLTSPPEARHPDA